MQIIFLWDNLHEMWNAISRPKKKKKICINLLYAEFAQRKH